MFRASKTLSRTAAPVRNFKIIINSSKNFRNVINLEGVLDAFKLIRILQNLNIAPSGHLETIQSITKDTSPSQEHQIHHQLQPKIYKCPRSLSGFLMLSNSTDFNQTLNIAPSGHVETIHNVIKHTSPSQ